MMSPMLLTNAGVNLTQWCSHMALIKEECYVSSLMTYHLVCNQKLLTLLDHLQFTPGFQWGSCCSILVLCACFVDRCLSFFFQPLCCMLFFDLWILNTLFVSTNSFYTMMFPCVIDQCWISQYQIMSPYVLVIGSCRCKVEF